MRALETRLGVPLLNRTTRSVAPTAAGRKLLDRIVPALADVGEAIGDIRTAADKVAGVVRINAPKLAIDLTIGRVLTAYLEAYPDVRIEIVVDDALSDVVGEGFDAGIRLGESVQKDMVAIRLTGPQQLAVVASPAYVARHGTRREPCDLRQHRCIGYRWTKTGALYRLTFKRDQDQFEVVIDAALVANDTDVVRTAAERGAGIAVLLEDSVRTQLAEGRLIRMLEAWCPPFPGFFLYYPSRRNLSPALRALAEAIRNAGEVAAGAE
jgi:DNA-binding transcriptional LysR family regulator